jgi:hypothetical protein
MTCDPNPRHTSGSRHLACFSCKGWLFHCFAVISPAIYKPLTHQKKSCRSSASEVSRHHHHRHHRCPLHAPQHWRRSLAPPASCLAANTRRSITTALSPPLRFTHLDDQRARYFRTKTLRSGREPNLCCTMAWSSVCICDIEPVERKVCKMLIAVGV